jgi:hypothetical protein
MIRDGLDVHYYTQPVASEDQAISLSEYLKRHGRDAFKNGSDEVVIPMECQTPHDAASASADVHTLISTWRMFWQHSDQGVFELPVYVKE